MFSSLTKLPIAAKQWREAISRAEGEVEELLQVHQKDIDKVLRKFHIIDHQEVGRVHLKRKRPKAKEDLNIFFHCNKEILDFDDDDGYDRVLYLLEKAEEKNLDYDDKIAMAEEKEGLEVDVHIDKIGHPRMTFNCIASDKFVIQKVYFHSDLSLKGDAAELKRLYNGPKYVNLEEPLRNELQDFLRRRLVDDFLSSFIYDYARIKREKEFVLWAKKMQNFIA